jgi:hypothetical protein
VNKALTNYLKFLWKTNDRLEAENERLRAALARAKAK